MDLEEHARWLEVRIQARRGASLVTVLLWNLLSRVAFRLYTIRTVQTVDREPSTTHECIGIQRPVSTAIRRCALRRNPAPTARRVREGRHSRTPRAVDPYERSIRGGCGKSRLTSSWGAWPGIYGRPDSTISISVRDTSTVTVRRPTTRHPRPDSNCEECSLSVGWTPQRETS